MYDVDVAQLQVKIAVAGLYPTLVLQGSVQRQQFKSKDAPPLSIFNNTVQANLTISRPFVSTTAATIVGLIPRQVSFLQVRAIRTETIMGSLARHCHRESNMSFACESACMHSASLPSASRVLARDSACSKAA
jgi:hypothetical protein